jgi:hypothetical protein
MTLFVENIYDDIYDDHTPDLSEKEVEEEKQGEGGNESDDLESISWIKDTERLHNISNNRERTPMKTIGVNFVYINKYNYIENVSFEKVDLVVDDSDVGSLLSKEAVLKIIQQHKVVTPTSRYKLVDILSFIVDVDHDDIPLFLKSSENHLSVLPIFNDIRIEKCMFIFNKINQLYFIFQEFDLHPHHRTTLKSILKSSASTSSSDTKKVRILVNRSKSSKQHYRSTRRKRPALPGSVGAH